MRPSPHINASDYFHIVEQEVKRVILPDEDQDRDELIQEGRIALVKASLRYDPAKGPFEPYARMVIRNAMRKLADKRFLIARRRQGKTISGRGRRVSHQGHRPSNHERSARKVDHRTGRPEKAVIRRDFLDYLMRHLTDEGAMTIECVFGLKSGMEQTCASAALQLGISPSRVNQIVKDALRTMRRAARNQLPTRKPK